jgi:hypothetical protein
MLNRIFEYVWHKRAELWTAERRVHFERQCSGLRVVLLKEGERQTGREKEKEKRRAPIKTDQRVFSHSFSLSLWRTLTFSSPLLYNVGRFCVDPENKQHSGGEGDLFALTVLASTVVIRTSASKRKRNREERIEEKICSSHVHSSLFLQYTYIGTPTREYMSNTRSEREHVHTNNKRIWTIGERIWSDEKWLLTIHFLPLFGCWLISLNVLKRGETHTNVYKVGKHVYKKWVWKKQVEILLASTLLIMIKLIKHNPFAHHHNFNLSNIFIKCERILNINRKITLNDQKIKTLNKTNSKKMKEIIRNFDKKKLVFIIKKYLVQVSTLLTLYLKYLDGCHYLYLPSMIKHTFFFIMIELQLVE